MFERIQNRKLRKLLNNPRQYVRDIKRLKPFFARFEARKTPGEAPPPVTTVPDDVILVDAPTEALGRFELVGENWLDTKDLRPIAILWGFSLWKRRFIATYLQEYRVAFARGKTSWNVQKEALDTMEGLHFVVWGMSETSEVKEYALSRAIPVVRVEDGFIRSAELGSAHTLPLSLAIDRRGLYYDANRPSDLEHLLATYDFAANPKLMAAAQALRRLHCDLKISKYNLGSFRSAFSILGPKIKDRVLVIGQVDDDASIRYGLAEGWTSHKLIELARRENPQAEIIYKPHPDVMQGYRSNSTELKNLQKICRVVSEEVMLADMFGVVDHVYVITSLSGMEAMLHGLKVTVVGAPFYAGWGLTDDRTPVKRRQRRLTLDELFCGAYLAYPRYLTDPEDAVVGCLAAMLRVTAQRRQRLVASVSAQFVDRRSAWLADSDSWALLFRKEHLEALKTKLGKKLLQHIPVARMLSASSDGDYQCSIAYFLAGQLRTSPLFAKVLKQIRVGIRPEHFSLLLVDLWSIQPSLVLLEQWADHNERIGEPDAARTALVQLSSHSTVLPGSNGALPIPPTHFAHVLKFAQHELRHRRLGTAADSLNKLLLSGYVSGDVFAGLAEISRLRFNFDGAARLLHVFNLLELGWKEGSTTLAQAHADGLAGNYAKALESMAVACLQNPRYVESAGPVDAALGRSIGELPLSLALQAAVEVSAEGSVISRARAFIAHERAADAENLLLAYSPSGPETLKYCLTLSLAYSYQGKLEKAKRLIVNLLPHFQSTLIYAEGLRLAVIANDYEWGEKLLDQATQSGIDVGDIYHRKIKLGLGDIKGGYSSFRKMRWTKTLRAYLPSTYVQDINALTSPADSTVTVMGFFGPGDEIRFASFYRDISVRCGHLTQLTFTCDPRLLPLLGRGYPDLSFVPVPRIRSLTYLDNYDQFNQLPGSELHTIADNAGWDLIKNSKKVTLATDLLGDLIDNYDSFRGLPYLRPDPNKVEHWRARLASGSGRPLVGLSWRSSLTTYSRNEHYLAVEDLVPLFDLEEIQFVNLQYDDCSEELKWLEKKFPGRVLNFEDLDQYNDLDGVAALMACMDVVVAPATTVVELSGALGCKTLLLSNSSELHWRKRPGTNTDTWHSSMTHVEGKRLGNKSDLIVELVERLRNDLVRSDNAVPVARQEHAGVPA